MIGLFCVLFSFFFVVVDRTTFVSFFSVIVCVQVLFGGKGLSREGSRWRYLCYNCAGDESFLHSPFYLTTAKWDKAEIKPLGQNHG